MLIKKFKFWCAYRKTKSDLALIQYKKFKNRSRRLLVKNEKASLARLFANKDRNLYKYIRKKINSNKSLPFTFKLDKGDSFCDTEIANAFNNYFYSVYNASKIPRCILSADIKHSSITISEVKHSLKKFSNTTSKGPEGLPVYFLKQLDDAFLRTLTLLYNQFLQYGFYPALWKTAIITPIYKNVGSRNEIKSYRPISVTNIFLVFLSA